MKWLSLLMLLPLAGAAIISALPKSNEKAAKQAALGTTLVVMAATIAMAVGFQRDNVDLQFVESYAWIPSFGINFSLGVDAIALVLILMSTILAPIVVLAGWDEAHGGRWSVKTFYILILVLETMMIGVFAATDLFLFYVIFEAMLIPVYFLIGGYGTGERAAAAVKFLLYSLFGGLLMLASIIALYCLCNQSSAMAIPYLVARCSKVSNTRYLGSTSWCARQGRYLRNDPLLPDLVPRCKQDIYTIDYGACCYLNPLRCFPCDWRKGHQAIDCIHIYLSLWFHHHGYLCDDKPGSKRCDFVHV
jgi:NADH:ubiquinone oxidoreductase subunit 4 (subunit M)